MKYIIPTVILNAQQTNTNIKHIISTAHTNNFTSMTRVELGQHLITINRLRKTPKLVPSGEPSPQK
jgi:hypothetical protein